MPSKSNSAILPLFQRGNLLSMQLTWSHDFEVLVGFCKSRMHITVAAFKAMDSKAEPSA